jgi:FtsH-binding integral membrane protein
METTREKDELPEREEDTTFRKTVYTFLGLGVLLVYFGVIYFLLALSLGNLILSILGVIGIIGSLVLLYRLSQKFIKYNPV